MNINEIADAKGAAIIIDRDGDIALLRRLYDADGVCEVRYAPDPCDHLPIAKWLSMTAGEVAQKVC